MKIQTILMVYVLTLAGFIGIAQLTRPIFSPFHIDPPSRPGFVFDTDITLPQLMQMDALHFEKIELGPIKSDKKIINAFIVAKAKDSPFKYYATLYPFQRVYVKR